MTSNQSSWNVSAPLQAASINRLTERFRLPLSRKQGRPSIRARLTPRDERGNLGTPTLVDVVEIDERGLTLEHSFPLSDCRVRIQLEGRRALSAEVELTWCRFNQLGHYTSGGRFVQPLKKTA